MKVLQLKFQKAIQKTLILVCSGALIACGGGGGTGDVSLAKTGVPLYASGGGSVNLTIGASSTITIGGGGGGAAKTAYAAESSNPAVASTRVVGSTLTINALSVGVATISVKDNTGSSEAVSIAVTVARAAAAPPVALYSTAQSSVTIASGLHSSYVIAGGVGPYTATSNNINVATAEILGNTLTITGRASGTASIAIFDGAGSSLKIAVAVSATGSPSSPLFTTAQANITITPGTSAPYLVGGGEGPYTVTSSNESIATARLAGTTMIVSGIGAGTAMIAVFDATGASTRTAVTVGRPTSTTPLYTTAQSSITIPVSADTNYLIAGGSAPYTISSSNASVAVASIAGNTLTVTGLSAGTANIAVFDSLGASLRIAVSVDDGPVIALYTTAPSPLSLAVAETTQIYNVGGGKAPYSASSSNAGVASAAMIGNGLKINGIANGAANVVIHDALGASSTIAVTVGSGAGTAVPTPLYTTAQSSITIASGMPATYAVAGGASPYAVASGDPAIANATIVGNALNVSGIKMGNATISVTDSAQTTIRIAVKVGAASALYSTAPDVVSIATGSSPAYTIFGGVAPYSATSSAAAVAKTTLDGNLLTITGVASGSANVVIRDAEQKQIAVAVSVL